MGEIKIFAKRLKEARENKGLKQNELAAKIEVTPATISAYENADGQKGKNPTLDKAINLANVLDVSLDWLCGIEQTNESVSITPSEWVAYLVELLSYPPTTPIPVEGYETIWTERDNAIRLDVSANKNNPAATISFYGNELKAFWDGLTTVMRLQESLDSNLYTTLVKAITDKYSALFTPGHKLDIADERNDLPF